MLLVGTAEARGLSHQQAVALLGLMGVGTIVGRFCLAALADLLGRRLGFLLSCLGVSIALMLWALADPDGSGTLRVEHPYFEQVQPGQQVRAVPGAGVEVEAWILGSSLFGAQLAAALGLPYAFASHFAPDMLEQALAIYALPKYGARRTAATPLREFGEDPESKGAVTIKTGQFGPYVTDTFVNATVPSDDNIEDMTAERAFELLAIRREKLGLEPGQAPAKTSRSKKAAPARTVKRGTTRKKK
jgi:hypothetical protein